jgi:carboxypeptidase Q
VTPLSDDYLDSIKSNAARLIGEALVDRAAWNKLAFMGDSFGHRMNGSRGQDLSVEWALAEMRREGLENVRAETARVPNWIRGEESLELLDPYTRPLVMMSYGNSVGTPPGGIVADALVVGSLDELEARKSEASGKIVVFSPEWTRYPTDESWENYLDMRALRISGHERAARFGAVAALVRSLYPCHARQAHTGAMKYSDDCPRIPAAALAPEDALMLHRIAARGGQVRLKLQMSARSAGEVDSANVVGEIVGREFPEQVIVLACQFDSWDVGIAGLDDAAGAMVVWEPLRLMKSLGIRPRRTIRTLLCTNEENGASGALAYRDQHREELRNHVAMIESDAGVFPPIGFRVSGSPETIDIVRAADPLLEMLGFLPTRSPVRAGVAEDIHPSVEAGDLPSLTLQGNNEPYSRYHHANGDTAEAVPPSDLARAVAGMAVMAYRLADLPARLPAGKGAGTRGVYSDLRPEAR